MSRDQTIELLNEADSFQRRLDLLLFTQETTVDYSTPGWVPGDPLYPRPKFHEGGQYIRYMVEEIDIDCFNSLDYDGTAFFIRAWCEPCEVYWVGPDPCWNCGVERVINTCRCGCGGFPPNLTRGLDELVRSSRAVGESFRGVRAQIAIIDEAQVYGSAIEMWNRIGLDRGSITGRGRPRVPARGEPIEFSIGPVSLTDGSRSDAAMLVFPEGSEPRSNHPDLGYLEWVDRIVATGVRPMSVEDLAIHEQPPTVRERALRHREINAARRAFTNPPITEQRRPREI